MHIIKTGGTWAWDKYFKGHALMNDDIKSKRCGKIASQSSRKKERITKKEKDERAMLQWYYHANFGEFEECWRKRFQKQANVMVTQVRHPIDRVISEYYFYKRRNNVNKTDKINWWTPNMVNVGIEDDIIEWVMLKDNMAHNRQAFWLLYDGETKGRKTIVGRPEDILLWWQRQTRSEEEMKEDLKKIIHENFRYISVMEEAEKSDEMFEILFERKPKEVKKKSHKSNKPNELAEEIRDLILDYNKLDLWLWEYVKNTLEQRLKQKIKSA